MRVRYSFGSRHTGHIANIKKQRQKYPKVLLEVIRTSDIILEVLDARFVGEMRNLQIEEMISKSGKKLVYVLNKADLIDFRVEDFDLPNYVAVSCKTGRGAKELRDKIKMEVKRFKKEQKELSESGDSDVPIRKRIHIGIIGYPNTGKSSLINLITRRGVARTGNQAGFTKGLQKIRFLKDIVILDSPGVIPEEEYSLSQREKIMKNAKIGGRTYSNVKHPEDSVYEIFEENGKDLRKYYSVEVEDFDEFMDAVGKKKGFLVSGGNIDLDRTSRIILRDWQDGNIKIKK